MALRSEFNGSYGNDVSIIGDDFTVATYLTTLLYRHLVIQIHTVRADQPVHVTVPVVDGYPALRIRSQPRFRDSFQRFWPSQRRTEWPPGTALTHEPGMTPDDFHARFKF